jgi:purine operon repressor
MVAIAHRLLQEPRTLFPLGTFTEMLAAAKSTISEDISALRETFERFAIGRVETLAGAAGGVRFTPAVSPSRTRALAEDLARRLQDPSRTLPGGFLYIADLLSLPALVTRLGEVFAGFFSDRRPDVVVSMEVQGIPLALMTARALNVPSVTIRRGGMGTEGPSVGVNYVSGSSRAVQSMTLPLRAVPQQARALFIDDFLRGGGTARGVHDLMREFQAQIVGVGVLIEMRQPRRKLVDADFSLLVFDGIDAETGVARVAPSASAAGGALTGEDAGRRRHP